MAFGGVAMGNINAQLAPKTKGILKISMDHPKATDKLKTSGIKALTKAILLSSSVAKTPKSAIMNTQIISGISTKDCMLDSKRPNH